MFFFVDCDPIVFEEAVKADKLVKAMDDEIRAIEKNDTWFLNDINLLVSNGSIRPS